MPTKLEGLLDRESLQDVSLKPTTWKPTRGLIRWSLDVMRPEFLTIRSSKTKKALRTTAWLDGLRGFSAFLVYIHHNGLWAHGGMGNLIFENSFGYEGRHYFSALPFVRIFFSGGHFAVAMFFVISGYALSVKSLSLLQSGKATTAADTIGSALFRRWLRLYIPIIAVTFTWVCFRHSTKIWMDFRKREDTFHEEVKKWYYAFKNSSFIFTGSVYEFSLKYHPHLWSIPLEFKGSIIIYTVLSALSRCTNSTRMWCEAGLVFYFLYIVDGYYGAMFMAGMLLCDLDLAAQKDQLPRFFTALSGFKEFIFFHMFVLALYLGGVPGYDGAAVDRAVLIAKSPGWFWLSYLKPQAVFDAKWFYLFWAAILAVASIPRLPWLKRFFETRCCQYLGRISFSLYLVHGLVIWSVCDRLYAAVGMHRPEHAEGIPQWIDIFPLPKKGPMGLTLAFWIPQIIILPLTLYLSEILTKLVDEPSVKFTNWLQQRAVAQTPSQPQPLHMQSSSPVL
ncbi:acyltransferase 3 [Ampelomyces quisqualis]|uniref:Acyltransferase 3 n=1 Tax=Ampelomyces quisqualis TaxID=50730 RepID=A0A6A5QV41_AMPQU|nr:acyltransferase 3 [Ampelomyces quisqualis]